jgi:hypothetical protein
MTRELSSGISCRRFLASSNLAATPTLLDPRPLWARTQVVQVPGLVDAMRKGGATATRLVRC